MALTVVKVINKNIYMYTVNAIKIIVAIAYSREVR